MRNDPDRILLVWGWFFLLLPLWPLAVLLAAGTMILRFEHGLGMLAIAAVYMVAVAMFVSVAF